MVGIGDDRMKNIFVALFLFLLVFNVSGCGVNQGGEDGQAQITSFENDQYGRGLNVPEGYSNVPPTTDEDFVREELSQLLLKMEEVRNVMIINDNDQLLMAIETDTQDPDWLKLKIKSYVHLYYPNRDIVIVTERDQVDEVRSPKSANDPAQGEIIGLQLRQFFHEVNGQMEKQDLN